MRSENEVINQVLDMAIAISSVRAVIRDNLLPKRKYLNNYDFFFVVDDIYQHSQSMK